MDTADACSACGRALRDDDVLCGACGERRGKSERTEPKRTDLDPPKSSAAAASPRWHIIPALILLVGIVPAGCFLLFFLGNDAEGTVEVRGPSGAYSVEPTECVAQHPYFGVRLGTESDGALFLRGREDGPAEVQLTAPGCDDFERCPRRALSPEACSQLDALVEPGSYEVNRRPVADGHVALRCQLDDGTTVAGRIDFSGCE
ncbi:MAG: hypothetical protein AB8I08_37950 [Sandaracinaceae bacterium]